MSSENGKRKEKRLLKFIPILQASCVQKGWRTTIEYWRWQGSRVPSADTEVEFYCFAEDKIYSQINNFPPGAEAEQRFAADCLISCPAIANTTVVRRPFFVHRKRIEY